MPKWCYKPMKKLAATFDFSDFAKSITYFGYFTTTGRSKTLGSFMENRHPASSRKKTKRSWAMMPIGGPKSGQTAVGDAIRKTPKYTKKLYTRKLSSSMEYQAAVQKYPALTKKRVNSCPDSGRTKLGEKGWEMMPTQAQARCKCLEMAPERSPKVTQSTPKWFEIDAKTCQDPKNDARRQNYNLVHRFWTDSGYLFG